MKIIMVESSYDHNGGVVQSAIAKLSGEELAWIVKCSGHPLVSSKRIRAGSDVAICERLLHLLRVEAQIAEAVTLPQKLRTLAEMLEMNHPAITAVVEEPVLATEVAAN